MIVSVKIHPFISRFDKNDFVFSINFTLVYAANIIQKRCLVIPKFASAVCSVICCFASSATYIMGLTAGTSNKLRTLKVRCSRIIKPMIKLTSARSGTSQADEASPTSRDSSSPACENHVSLQTANAHSLSPSPNLIHSATSV